VGPERIARVSDLKVGRIAQLTHTPGPWCVSELDGHAIGPVRVLSAHGTDVPQLQAVARVMPRAGETEANAQLIAAAPALLEALKLAVEAIRVFHGLGLGPNEADTWALYQHSPEMQAINAAIAYAEGR
jgi:hypothetical protein